MTPLQALTLKLQGLVDESSRKLLIKLWLEYHTPTGEKLNTRRPTEICNPAHCDKQGKGCPTKLFFKEYWFCCEH